MPRTGGGEPQTSGWVALRQTVWPGTCRRSAWRVGRGDCPRAAPGVSGRAAWSQKQKELRLRSAVQVDGHLLEFIHL